MKKIMFNDKYGLTKAVLEGRKTMTRRIIKSDWLQSWGDKGKVTITYDKKIGCFLAYVGPNDDEPMVLEPKYKVGELVAVAQSYKDVGIDPACNVLCGGRYVSALSTPGWNNKMFVHPDHMKHFIRVTNVRIERLQDISDEDSIREGIRRWRDCPDCPEKSKVPDELYEIAGSWYGFRSPREAFAALIDKVSGKGTFESNPYVFVYEFELVK